MLAFIRTAAICCQVETECCATRKLFVHLVLFVATELTTMPPKKAASSAVADATVLPKNINNDWTARRQGWLLNILTNPVFADADNQEALVMTADNVNDRGYMEPFRMPALKKMVADEVSGHTSTDESVYVCGGNLFWLDLHYNITPNVPILEDKVKDIITLELTAGPKQFPTAIDVNINFVNKLPMGKCEQISAIEISDALLWHISTRIDAGANEEELKRWRRMCLSMPFRFMRRTSDDAKYKHVIVFGL